MRQPPLWKVSLQVRLEAEEAAADLLTDACGQTASAYHDFETGLAAVSVYLPTPPDNLAVLRATLRDGLDRLRQCGLDVGPAEVTTARLRSEDWAESWKRHFRPLQIGAKLLIRPSWSRRKARPSQRLLVLDPGLSFGTGQHPTTAFCLAQVAARRRPGTAQSFLDLGCGSGILALAAAALGYAPVEALDFDPEAVRAARANARTNRLAGRVRIARQDLRELPLRSRRKYDLLCANLISNLLLEERDRILARLATGGTLVLAGILAAEFDRVRAAYESAGLRLTASRHLNEWRSGAFRNQRETTD